MLESQALEITEDDVVDFMMHGFDRTDEDMIFGAVARQAYLFTDCVLLVFNFRDEVGDLAEIRFALQAQKSANPKKSSHLISLVSEAGFEPVHPLSGH